MRLQGHCRDRAEPRPCEQGEDPGGTHEASAVGSSGEDLDGGRDGIAEYVTPDLRRCLRRELESRNSMDPLKECWAGIAALPADKSHRWAGFLRHMTAEQAVKILRGLKLDNDTIGNVKEHDHGIPGTAAVDKVEIRRLLSRVTEYQFLGAMQLKKLDGDETVPEILRLFEEIREAGDCVSLKQLAVNGGDLLAKVWKRKADRRRTHVSFEFVLENQN